MNWLDINVMHFQYYILVFVRVLSMITLAPVFGSGTVPFQAKAGLGLVLSFIVYPVVGRDFPPIPDEMILFWMMVLREAVIGIMMGVVLAALFATYQLAGQIYGMQVGFGIVNVMDPLSETQISILGQFQFMLAILIFLSVNGHHLIIMAIANSYSVLPMNAFHITEPMTWIMVGLLQKMFVIALKVGMPIIASLIVVTVAMGLVARTVPQINVFIVGMPVNIGVGLFMMAASMGYFSYVTKMFFAQAFRDIWMLFRLAGSG